MYKKIYIFRVYHTFVLPVLPSSSPGVVNDSAEREYPVIISPDVSVAGSDGSYYGKNREKRENGAYQSLFPPSRGGNCRCFPLILLKKR